MNAYTSSASLVIHPEDPDWYPENPEAVTQALQALGLAAEEIEGEANSYLVGEKFLDLVAFMGCSPSISFTPGEDSSRFTFIRVTTSPDRITALTGQHSFAPHCPACKKPVTDWRESLSDNALPCTNCGAVSPPWLYNWRRSAGFARCFIEITDIYPKEAIPQDALLSSLENINQGAWKYFYHHP